MMIDGMMEAEIDATLLTRRARITMDRGGSVYDRASEIAAMSDHATAQMEADVLDGEIATMAADADAEVRAGLFDDLRAARTETEVQAIQALIESRHWWLEAHFRDAMTGATEPSYWARQADRQWEIVAAERAMPGYAELTPWADSTFTDDVAF